MNLRIKYAKYLQRGRGEKQGEAGGVRERRDYYLSSVWRREGAHIASVLCQLYISVH